MADPNCKWCEGTGVLRGTSDNGVKLKAKCGCSIPVKLQISIHKVSEALINIRRAMPDDAPDELWRASDAAAMVWGEHVKTLRESFDSEQQLL